MQSRLKRVVSSWIAILAILLNALMPTISVAFESNSVKPSSSTNDWIEVCTVQGSTWVRLAPDGTLLEQTQRKPAEAPSSAHGEHCPYCLTHAASFALPPVPPLIFPVWPLPTDFLPGCEAVAPTAVAWLAPAARAPPSPFF
jgi:hypothetical protein